MLVYSRKDGVWVCNQTTHSIETLNAKDLISVREKHDPRHEGETGYYVYGFGETDGGIDLFVNARSPLDALRRAGGTGSVFPLHGILLDEGASGSVPKCKNRYSIISDKTHIIPPPGLVVMRCSPWHANLGYAE